MARFIDIINGVLTQLVPITSSAGITDANKIVQTGAGGKLDLSLMPAEITAQAVVLPASEALTAGDIVNIWYDVDTTKARKADASASRAAHGYVTAGAITDAEATVYTEGFNNQLTSLTPGSTVWLGESGAVTQTPPTSGSGGISQIIGVATSATTIEFEPNDPVTLASS